LTWTIESVTEADVDPEAVFALYAAFEHVVRPAFMRIINVYEVEPTAGGARVRHAFEVSGPIASTTRALGLARMYQRRLHDEVAAVVRMASSPLDSEPRIGAPVSLPERVWHGLGRLIRRGRDR
jgi:hypothetical protein